LTVGIKLKGQVNKITDIWYNKWYKFIHFLNTGSNI